MAVARGLSEGEALARSGNWKNWDLDQLVGTDVWGKTLGIVDFFPGRAFRLGPLFFASSLSIFRAASNKLWLANTLGLAILSPFHLSKNYTNTPPRFGHN